MASAGRRATSSVRSQHADSGQRARDHRRHRLLEEPPRQLQPVRSSMARDGSASVACYFGGVTDPEQAAFAAQCEEHRRMLRVHCYRMTGSFDDAEDMVQETFLRAWRAREGFDGRSRLSTWLFRIATNVCLDALEH